MENNRRTRHLKNDRIQPSGTPQEQNPAEERAAIVAMEGKPMIEPATSKPLLTLLATLPDLADKFPPISEPPVDDVVL